MKSGIPLWLSNLDHKIDFDEFNNKFSMEQSLSRAETQEGAPIELLYNDPELLKIIVSLVPFESLLCLRRTSRVWSSITPDTEVLPNELIASFLREGNIGALCKLFGTNSLEQTWPAPNVEATSESLIQEIFVPSMISSGNLPVIQWLVNHGDIPCQPSTRLIIKSGYLDMIKFIIANSNPTKSVGSYWVESLADAVPCDDFKEIMEFLIPFAGYYKELTGCLVRKGRFDMARLMPKKSTYCYQTSILTDFVQVPDDISARDLWWLTKNQSSIKILLTVLETRKVKIIDLYCGDSSRDPYANRFVNRLTSKISCLSKEKCDGLNASISLILDRYPEIEHFREPFLRLISDARI